MIKTYFLLFIAVVIAFLDLCEGYCATTTVRPQCPENEFYAKCGANCQTECATLNKPCLIRHVICPEGCYCNNGFARDATGKCVRIGDCAQIGAYN